MDHNTHFCTGWGFPPEFKNQGNDVVMVTDEDDIKQSLEILFTTAIKERLHYPNFGCDLKKFMFDHITHSLVIELKDMILEAIYAFEPRIEVQEIDVTESEEEAHLLHITIDYVIIKTQTMQNIFLPLNLY